MKLLLLLVLVASISYSQTITYDTIQVNSGWNLIGAVEEGAITNIITTVPQGIIVSSFFGYSGLYVAEDTLSRGKGYWVKVSEPGIIVAQLQIPTPFNPCAGLLTVYYEGKTYNTIAIGTQCWLRENLNVGTTIPSSQNPENNGIIEKYCYNNDSINCLLYGGLYRWNEAMQYSTIPSSRGICPLGWHIPLFSEFSTLSMVVNQNGNPLKAVGQGYGGGTGTNTTGFSALLAGWWYDAGGFVQSDFCASFWSSTEYLFNHAGYWQLISDTSYWDGANGTKEFGFSVRCLKD